MEKDNKYRRAFFYKDYFQDFFDSQSRKVKDKIIWTIELVEEVERIPDKFFRHIENTDGLYEIRVEHRSDIFRIFCFFDEGKLLIIGNGFQKKTQKTPRQEIEKALKIKQDYENEK